MEDIIALFIGAIQNLTFNLYIKLLIFVTAVGLVDWGSQKILIFQNEMTRKTSLILCGILFIVYVILD